MKQNKIIFVCLLLTLSVVLQAEYSRAEAGHSIRGSSDRRPYHSAININQLQKSRQPYHERSHPKQFILNGPLMVGNKKVSHGGRRYLEGAGAVLNVSATTVEGDEEITVPGTISCTGPNDWIGCF